MRRSRLQYSQTVSEYELYYENLSSVDYTFDIEHPVCFRNLFSSPEFHVITKPCLTVEVDGQLLYGM